MPGWVFAVWVSNDAKPETQEANSLGMCVCIYGGGEWMAAKLKMMNSKDTTPSLKVMFHKDYFFFLVAVPRGMWGLSSPTRDGTCAPCSGSVES